MTKLNQLFGDIADLRVKSFDLNGHKFKVRIPLTKEMEDMAKRIDDIPDEEIEKRFQKMTTGFKESDKIEGVEFTDNDVVVNGRSTRDIAKQAIQVEKRVEEYFRLLIPADGQVNDLTYQDIDDVFPFSVQLDVISAISDAIQPGYKEQRKNS
jgi:hypothetical protein